MTGRAVAVVAALAAGAAVLRVDAQGPPATQPPQTFRTGTDLVLVDVSVRTDGRAVTGLRAEDFVLTDNGVRQGIESIEATAVPIDLTLVADVSGNPRGPAVGRTAAATVIAALQAEVQEVARMLRPEDRIRLLAIDRHVQLASSFSAPSSIAPVRLVEFGGLAALYDTLAAALLQPVAPARRHVVIARTKGRDTISAIDADAVRTIAERADALFHLVLMETALDNDTALSGFQCVLAGLCSPTRRFWVPLHRRLTGGRPVHALMRDGETLAAAAEATGGRLHKASGLSEPTLTGTFKKAFEDFRSSYVLRYTPQGVSAGGWHAIDVEVPAFDDYTVRARKGYGVETAPAAPEPAAIPDVPKTLLELIDAYEREAYPRVVSALRQTADPARLMREFEEAGNPWPAAPRREAAFALELAETGVFSSDEDTREQAYAMLERFSRLIRHPLEPDAFERYWHFAALTLLEGSIRPGVTEAFVTRALERFPDEPRFALSRAIVAGQRWARPGQQPAGPAPSRWTDAAAVRRHYEAAIALPETAAAARIRYAWFLHRTGQHDEALSHLTAAGAQPIGDPSMRYLRQLFLGDVLGALERPEEAIAAFRAAVAERPTAQAARVALMNALLVRGDRSSAEALADQIQTETSRDLDPWWLYWQGQYRMYPLVMARVREMIE